MSTESSPRAQETRDLRSTLLGLLTGFLIGVVIVGLLLLGALVLSTSAGQSLGSSLNWLFAVDSVQLWWYVTRAAGIIAYLLLWFSTIWGLAVPSRILDPLLERGYTFDFHQFISLLGLGFALLHILVLSLDRYLPYSAPQLLIPFLSPYRPLWVGIGVIAFYIIVLVTVTFYIRGRIGMRNFRVIHYLSLLGYLGVTIHGLYAGTDAALPAMQLVYYVTGLSVVFFTAYWLIIMFYRKFENMQKAVTPKAVNRQHGATRYSIK